MPVARSTVVCALVALVGAAAVLAAQTDTTACPSPNSTSTAASQPATDSARAGRTGATAVAARDTSHPTIALLVEATASQVRFTKQPTIRVRLCGATTDSVHVIERRNLPDHVQPGVVYRDVYVAVEILGHLNSQCLMQRLGVASAQPSATPAAGQGTTDPCTSLTVRDSTGAARAAPPGSP
jgi:archaellum component FlaG (FlaF/FlaG flagellin family)